MRSQPRQLEFLSREKFAELPLSEKNSYLQRLADDYADLTDRPRTELDRDALSRLRRYYSRRVWADLKLPKENPTPVDEALARLGEAVRMERVRTDVTAGLEASLPGRKTLRVPPTDDAQLSFFIPKIFDAPIKDDVNLMDVAPFALGKNARQGVIQYELKDCIITVEGGAQSGLATIFDYDIFLNMVSYLAEEVRRFHEREGKGLRPSLPPKVYRPNAIHILKFCRRSVGGKAYLDLEAALDRLSKTTIKIVNLAGGSRRQVDSRPLIGGYQVVTKTSKGMPDGIEIVIPDWVWHSVVRPDRTMSLLTLNEDYFLISSGIGRFIYRLARKAAGKTEARYKVAELHRRSGSSQEYRYFARDIRQFVATTKLFPLPDYDMALTEGRGDMILHMKRRETEAVPSLPIATPPLIENQS